MFLQQSKILHLSKILEKELSLKKKISIIDDLFRYDKDFIDDILNRFKHFIKSI